MVDKLIMKGVPKLRFKKYTEGWKEYKLEDISDNFRSGINITSENITQSGPYPVYGGNGLRGYSAEFTHDGTYILVGRQGALCGNINLVSGKNYISEHAIAVSTNSLASEKWLAYKLELMQLNRLSESSAQPGLAVGKLLKLKVKIPSLPEQQKIASFLSAVDEKISQLKRKKELLEQYKKGVMQQLFSRKIRFKDEKGKEFPEWEEKKLGEIAQKINTKNRSGVVTEVLTNSATSGIVSQSDYFDRSIANPANISGYYVVEFGDFVYNPRVSVTAPVGPIKRNKLVRGVMSPLYTVFRFKIKNLDYIEYYFETDLWHSYLEGVANQGARHDRMNISQQDFFNLEIPWPSELEQRKIAEFCSLINMKLSLVFKELSATQTFKKGLLQQMFV